MAGAAFCWMHDPDSADARREAARTGGRNRSAKARAAKLIPPAMAADELAGYLTALFKGVMTGRIEPKIGTAAATIARTLLEAQTAAAQPTIEELQEQVARLRAMVERTAGGRAA